MKMKQCNFKDNILKPGRIRVGMSVVELVDGHFNAFNSARLAEICRLMENKVLKEDVTIGVSLSGALTPAGLGASAVVPLIENGFVDYIVSTGANLYHDIHFALDIPLYKSSPFVDDLKLREEKLIRIYDILADFDALVRSDKYLYKVFSDSLFHKKLSTSELHYLLGMYIAKEEEKNGVQGTTILAAAYKAGVPVYCPSPGDSTIGLNMAAKGMYDGTFTIDVMADINETAAIAYDAAQEGKNAVLIFGGGSPKNFLLQTVPQINEILEIPLDGHDYFMQITDARPDTGGLSGATPSEAVTWGKLNPESLPDCVVAYADITIAMPIITAYVLEKCKPRRQKRLFDMRGQLVEKLRQKYMQVNIT
ncbi:MAG: deoxyhypusine synthase-like protein [bacterium]|nr:MAG: deoxyhypusine synthase-like protein [bacterium]